MKYQEIAHMEIDAKGLFLDLILLQEFIILK